MSELFVELDGEDEQALREQLSNVSADIVILQTQRFDAVVLIQLLASLNAVTIPVLTKLLVERLRANRHVVVKKNGQGVSVAGLGAQDVVKVLEQLQKQ